MTAVLVCALVAAAAAAALTPLVRRRVAERDSRALRLGGHVVLAALGGAGAGALADGWAQAVTFTVLAVACAVLVVVDVVEYRLPDVVVLPMYPVLAVGLTLAAATQGEWSSLGRAAAGAAALLVGYFVLALINPAGLGLGDVKLAGVLGAFLGWLGWPHVLLGTLAAFVLGGLVAAGLLLARRADRHSSVAFGPWMILGAAVGAAWGPVLVGG